MFEVNAKIALAVAVACVSIPQATGAQNRRSLTLEREIQTSLGSFRYFPRCDDATLVGFETNHSAGPVLFVSDRNGRTDKILFTIPEVGFINLFDKSASSSGDIAVVGDAYGNDGKATTFLARIEPGGKRQIITRTWPYCPATVAFAPDGTIWTMGHLKDEENTRVVAYHVLRRFDLTGRMLSSTTVASKVLVTDEMSFLRRSRDRVVWFSKNNEYVEFDLDGSELDRFPGPAGIDGALVHGLAISENNDVFISVGNKKTDTYDYFALDRPSATWIPVSTTEPRRGAIYGFDGLTLVTGGPAGGRLRRFSFK